MVKPHGAVPFSEAFRAHAAIQEIISAAFREGAPIVLDVAVTMLRSADCDAALPGADLKQAVAEAAIEAGVTVIEQPAAA